MVWRESFLIEAGTLANSINKIPGQFRVKSVDRGEENNNGNDDFLTAVLGVIRSISTPYPRTKLKCVT